MSNQSSCTGLLVFQQATGQLYSSYQSMCYGKTTTIAADDAADLVSHHESRELSMEYKNAAVYSLHCLGNAVYQVGPNPSGETPPPMCIGVEFLRYSQAMLQEQQQLQHHAASRSPADTLTTSHHHAAAGSSYRQSSSSSDASAPYQPAQQQTAPYNNSSSSSPLQDDEERLGLFEKMQRRREEINSRLEGQDPLWFAKAFANRASLNWDSMKRVAGDIAAQAKADLGFAKPDETE